MSFVEIRGEKFYHCNQEIRFSGLGVGSWLNLEHFMLGIPTPESMIKEAFEECFGKERQEKFWDKFVREFIREEDFRFMKKIGINLLRVPFNYHLFIDDNQPDCLKEDGFLYFDYLLELCRKYKIFLMPDMHTVPGGENPDWHSDNKTGIPQFWHYKIFQEQVTELWKSIAARYAEEEYLLGYDLLNEPFLMPAKNGKLQEFYEETTRAIREVDKNHIIFLEGDFFAMDISAISEIKDRNTAITFHFYPTVWEENLGDEVYPRKQRQQVFEERFAKMIGQMRQFKRPLLCGEAGYDIKGKNMKHVMELVEDTLELFEKYQISWTLWCYKDACFMGLVYPEENSLWMQFAREIEKEWTHYKEMDMGKSIIADIAKIFPGRVSQEILYELQFRQRAILFVLQKEQILKPLLKQWGWEKVEKMPESFAMQNCQYHECYKEVLAKYSWKDKPEYENK